MNATASPQLTQAQLTQAARQALTLMDLTSLNDSDTDSVIEALCQQVKTPFGNPAAVCVYPQFIVTAARALSAHKLESQVKIATVTNFPHGGDDIMGAARETREAVASGAHEVDVVFPYRALMAGDEETGRELVEMCKAACGGQAQLKVIIESGELKAPALIQRASELAIEGGADFIKTSTGKVPVNATLDAAEITTHAIQKHRHGESTDLRVADAVVGDALYEGFDLFSGKRLAVVLQANQFLGEQGVVRSVRRHLVASIRHGISIAV